MAKVQFIKKWCVDNGYTYKKILNDDSITKIYELLNSNFIVPFELIEFCYYGSYYKEQKDYVNMKKYYLMAIEKGHSNTMNNLGLYYHEQKDYVNMKKYYLMAIEKGDSDAMYNLGLYYSEQKDYVNMKKYYLMAIEKGDSDAMYNLGLYYDEQKDYDNMKKYYLMAIEKGHFKSLNNYIENTKDYKLAYKYKSKLNNENKKLLEQYLSLCTQYLNNKIELTKDQCCVCLEEKYLQPFINCSHSLCNICYTKVNKCPLCLEQKYNG
jgi:uncharacterized protein